MTSIIRLAAAAAALTITLVHDPAPAAAGCPIAGCGANSPIMYGTPIEALHARGDASPQGVELVPSLDAPRCRWLMRADRGIWVYRNELLGGQYFLGVFVPTCRGIGLVGATFSIAVPGPNGPVTHAIRVVERGTIETWEREAGRRHVLPTYGLTIANGSTLVPFCPRRESWAPAWQLPFFYDDAKSHVITDAQYAKVKEETDHLLLTAGEIYDDGAGVPKSGPAWFTIACVGTALAKMRLLGFDPQESGTTKEERMATLKMLTARYRDQEPYTAPDTPLLYLRGGRPADYYLGIAPPARVGPIESRWSAAGAECLSHQRIWRADPTPAASAGGAGVRPDRNLWFAAPRLDFAPRSSGASENDDRRALAIVPCGPPGPAVWTTYTIDHADRGP